MSAPAFNQKLAAMCGMSTEQARKIKRDRRLKAVICYICQREFHVKKIISHVTQCKQSWRDKMSKLPPQKRLPLPSEPPGYKELLILQKVSGKDLTGQQVDQPIQIETNILLEDKSPEFRSPALNRSSLDMPIKVGMKSTDEMIEQMMNVDAAKHSPVSEENMESCPHCSRKFFPGRL